MTILDNLKRIFEGKFRDVLSNNNITLFDFSRNQNETLELKEGNKLVIDLSRIEDSERKLIKEKIIDPGVQTQDEAFLLEPSSKKTEKIKRNLPVGSDEELLKFYKDKIKPEMYKSLEASLIVRNAFNKGEDILELKKDISKNYPAFGKNLCNLTTQGYFDKHFKDLYTSMIEEEGFDITTYQEKVEKIVISLPYIIFVTRYKSYDELSGEVHFKLEKLKRYGTGKLLLHGLGRENVNTTLNILDEYKRDGTITIQTETNQKKTIITATLIF